MANLIVHTYLSTTAALRLGITTAGSSTVCPTAEQLQILTEDERLALSKFVSTETETRHKPNTLTVAEPGWDAVVVAVRTHLAASETERAKLEAHIESERQSYRLLLAAERLYAPDLPLRSVEPKVAWNIGPNYSRGNEEAERLWQELVVRRSRERVEVIRAADAALEYDVVNDDLAPQIRAVLETRDSYHETIEQHTQLAPRAWQFKARLDEEKSVRSRAWFESAQALAREYVIAHVPDYARAAQEGCDVRGIAIRVLEQRLEDALDGYRYDDEAIRDVEAHSCPNALAYERLEEVELLVELYRDCPLVESITSRIVRVKLRVQGEHVWRTMVELSVQAKYALPEIVDLYRWADVQPEPEYDDDSDDDSDDE